MTAQPWLVAVVLLTPNVANAGWSATQISKVEHSERTDRSEMFYDAGHLRIDAGTKSYVISMKAGSFLFMDHDQKTYAQASLEQIVALQKEILDLMKARLPQLPVAMQQMVKAQIDRLENAPKTAPKITETDKRETINGLACRVVRWNDGVATNRACIANNPPVDVKPFLKESRGLASKLSEMGATNAAPTSALFYMPGLPIFTRREDGRTVTTTSMENLKKFVSKKDTFAVPKTYAQRALKDLVAPGF